jgi:hypothetical protein
MGQIAFIPCGLEFHEVFPRRCLFQEIFECRAQVCHASFVNGEKADLFFALHRLVIISSRIGKWYCTSLKTTAAREVRQHFYIAQLARLG